MKINRRKARIVSIGSVRIGGKYPIAIQSMAKFKTSDTENVLVQLKRLENSGCEIVRLAVRDKDDACAIKKIKKGTSLPVVADIHFDWRLAVMAAEGGADKIRLNPGNIYRITELKNIVGAARLAGIPIRVGVNSGSVSRYFSSIKIPMHKKLVLSAMDYIRKIERMKFRDIVVSLKASNVFDTVEAYRDIAGRCEYPLHLGVTATGLPLSGVVKSSIALGSLLKEGIGDTIRISLTQPPEEEIKIGRIILQSLGLRHFGPEVVSCPTCGRCEVDLIGMVAQLENKLHALGGMKGEKRPLKLAVMGCVVNGPGEAAEADLGVAFGSGQGLLFKKGKALRKVRVLGAIQELLKEVRGIYV